jgi:hypothetical protein
MTRGTQCPWLAPAILISSIVATLVCGPTLSLSARAAESAKPGPAENGPPYIRFDPIFVSVIEGNRVARQIGVTLVIELIDAKSKPDVEALRKQLNDAFFRELYGFFQTKAGAAGQIDQVYLKRRLLATAGRIVGQGIVKEVLVEQLFERRS